MTATNTATTTLKPLIDDPAIVVENDHKALVIADLHLGIEAEFRQKGINIGSQTDKILEHAIACVEAAEPDVIILLGDVKHAVPQILWSERKEVPLFLARLAEHAPVYVIKGNHDGNIDKLLPELAVPECTLKHEIAVKSAQGFLLDNVGYTHGHSWPAPELFTAQYILIGHNHPQIRLVSASSRYRSMKTVWIRAQCNYEAVMERYPDLKLNKENTPRVVIMPAFNELCGGVAFNTTKRELLGPIASKLLRTETMEAYLLDGTYIGKVSDLEE